MSRTDLLRFVLEKYFRDANKSSVDGIDDKNTFYESSTTDSGFLSSGNLLVSSSEILDSGELQQDSGVIDEDFHQQEHHQQDKHSLMRLDSGIDTCLSSQFSNLSMKRGLNDLSCTEKSIIQTQQQEPCWELFNEQDEDGDTHLHIAILKGFIEVVAELIKRAPHPRLLDTPNDEAQSPLHLAVATGQWRIARWLIVAGARPCPRNICGDSPLHIAARMGDFQCCRAITDPVQQRERDLLKLSYQPTTYLNCDFNQWNYDGQTCIHVAAINGHVDILRHLVWYGADINAREGRSGFTALHYAIERSDERLVHFLLDECKKINVEIVSYGGRSALQLGLPVATTIIDTLLGHGVSPPYSSDEEDDSEDEIMYEAHCSNRQPNLVNASA